MCNFTEELLDANYSCNLIAFEERVPVGTIVRVCDTQTTQGLLPAVDENQTYFITVQGTGFGSDDLSWY